MIDSTIIKENYKRLNTEELIELAKDPWSLDAESFPYLYDELLDRGLTAEALVIANCMSQQQKACKDLSKDELKSIINERIENGELLENIRLDLKDQGVDIFELFADDDKKNEEEQKNRIVEYMAIRKKDGLNDVAINEEVSIAFDVDQKHTEFIHDEVKTSGWLNIIGGLIMVAISIFFILTNISTEHVTLGSIILLCGGVWRITVGLRQKS